MKTALVLICFSVCAFAQEKTRLGQEPETPRMAAACGPAGTSFKVNVDRSQHGPLQPAPGQALVYFIHEAGVVFGSGRSLGYPTTKYGLDGAWAGATHGDSWFAVPVGPGEHHVCASLQTSIMDERVELVHFTAEAGKSYYFRSRLVLSGSVELLEFQPADSDQGVYLVSSFPMAQSRQKK
jgi:hypothetical protein